MRTVPLDQFTPKEYAAYMAANEEARQLALASPDFVPPAARAARRRAEAIDQAVAARIYTEKLEAENESLKRRLRVMGQEVED